MSKPRLSRNLTNIFKFMCIALTVLAFLYLLNTCFFSGNKTSKIDVSEVNIVQQDALEGNIEEGTPIAIITTSYGEIRAVLYPEQAPNTVQNFINLANSGYYDNSYVFRIQKDTYFAGGSADKEGNLNTEVTSEDTECIDNELSKDLWPFKGAFCSLSSKSNCSGSRFMVVNSVEYTDEFKQDLLDVFSEDNDTRLADTFIKYGGIPNFSQQNTIFAQTYYGFDVIDKICSQDVTDAENDDLTPAGDILIEKIEISEYHKEDTIGSSNTAKVDTTTAE